MLVEEARSARTSIRIGTRGSHLARWQAEWVADRLRAHHPGLSGRAGRDQDPGGPRPQLAAGRHRRGRPVHQGDPASPGRRARRGRRPQPERSADARPRRADPGRRPAREDVADALIAPRARTLDALPQGATVGTGSLRRRAQLLHARPDLKVVGVRGNVETRLNKALSGELDAVVLAEAGLRRLGLDGHVTQRLGPPSFLPAVGQGALGIECRSTTRRRSPCSLRSTTRRPTARSSPSVGSWPSWRGAA